MARENSKQTKEAPSAVIAAKELLLVSRFYREMTAEITPARTPSSVTPANLESLEKLLMERSSAPSMEAAVKELRRCLSLLDASITPFLLRIHIERRIPIAVETASALLRYFLTKPPIEDADRDKLDYLATLLFSAETDHPLELGAGAGENEVWLKLFSGLRWDALAMEQQDLLAQLGALIPRLEQYTDFEELVNSKVVHQARSIKKSLSSFLTYPEVIKQMVKFNLAFRKRFEELFREETERVRLVTRESIQDGARLKAYFAAQMGLDKPQGTVTPGSLTTAAAGDGTAAGGAVEELKERPELEKYQRKFTRPLEEMQLKALTTRIREYFAGLRTTPAVAVLVPLTHASFAVSPWEVEAFMSGQEADEATRSLYGAIQQAVVLRGRLEEELALYREKRETRYLWKPHFDSLSYAVGNASGWLVQMEQILRHYKGDGRGQLRSKLARTALELIQMLQEVGQSVK